MKLRRSVLVAAVVAASLATGGGVAGAQRAGLAGIAVDQLFEVRSGAGAGAIYAAGVEIDCDVDCFRIAATSDGGRQWTARAATGWSGRRLTVVAGDSGVFLVAPGEGATIERSADLGETFETVATPGLMVGPSGRPDLIVAVAADDLWALDPVSGSQTKFPFKLPSGLAVTVSASLGSADPQATFVGGLVGDDGASEVVRCTDTSCVLAWSSASPIRSIDTDNATGVVVIADDGGALSVSSDDGLTFSVVTIDQVAASPTTAFTAVGFAANAIHVAVAQSGDEAGASGVYESTNRGTTWARIGTHRELDRGAYAVVRGSDRYLYAAFRDAEAGPGVACFAENGWAEICAGPTAVLGTTSTVPVIATSAPTTTAVAAGPLTTTGTPSTRDVRASNAFFAIAIAVLIGGGVVAYRGRRRS